MGAWVLLLPLLMAMAQAQAQAQVCSVAKNLFEVKENTNLSGPLVTVDVPQGQQVTLAASSTPFAFRIQGNQLFLNVTPDYEENALLQADLECKRGDTVVTQLRVWVSVLDVNDNPPTFPFVVRVKRVPEDTKVNTTVIPATELQAQDLDKDDILFYSLQEVTPGASAFFSLVGANLPALQLDRTLDLDRWPNMTFQLLVRDTREENVNPSHTATATLVLEVQPVDLRPPWFLPCAYRDSYVCIQAQYHGAVPTGYQLPTPLILDPGPIYAVDGDAAINQRITYSIIGGHEDTFTIDTNSGNLTMTRSVDSPKTFLLWVKGEQEDQARYSVTQVTVEARDAIGSLPRFPESLYRGTVALGAEVGEAVKDAAAPSQSLRIRAQDPDFPDLNSAITYGITNNSNFRMAGETVQVAKPLVYTGVFYAEVEAKNTVTAGTATTVVEIRVSEQETIPTGTTLRPPASPTPEGPSSVGTSTSPPSASPSGGSAQTQKPGTSQPRTPGPSRTPQPSGTPGAGGGSATGDGEPGHTGDRNFSTAEMAAVGGVLGALLLLALIALTVLIYKHYGHRCKCCAGKALEPQPGGFDNKAFLTHDGEANWAPAPSPEPCPTSDEAPPEPLEPTPLEPAPPAPPSLVPPACVPESPMAAQDGGSPAEVRSILTKERRPEGGYKAVWFGEDIGAEADVVVLNVPTSDADGAGDWDSQGGGAAEGAPSDGPSDSTND
ncbi:cadherin-related family member 5 isoform X2 [Equus caballus]|uniref:cadherin-related family member 5 isoform X2 n=1 Tax=Equus caballus TaxID=9796 RepID=UPI000C9E4594|nr:cadherin-related family member 5 isoform X2 [Equus caballus]